MYKSIPKTLILAMCVATPVFANGASRSPEEAKNVAADFFRTEKISRLSDKDALTLVHVVNNGSLSPVSYVFNAKDGKGFIIVSAEDEAIPVIGYSDTNIWDIDAAPTNVQSLLSIPVYDDGEVYSITAYTRAIPNSSKLLETPQWSQEAPFNNKIPNRRLVGCVGVALAEIMKYHEYPAQRPTTLVNGGESAGYDWGNMSMGNYRGGYSSEEADAVSALIADAAIAIGTDFGMSSSSAFEVKVPGAISSLFGYDAGVSYKKLSEISQKEWVEILINEIDADRPVLFSGQDVSAGHAFVCDGYKTDAAGSTMLHFNWGWGGSANGYFSPGALNPSVSKTHYYNNLQTIVYNIQPATNNLTWSPIHITNDENQPGLTIDVTDISSVDNFTLRAGTLKNISNNDFSGQLSIALFSSDGTMKTLLNDGRNFNLIAYQMTKYVDFTGKLPPGVSVASDDVVRLVTRANGESAWQPVAGDLLVMGEARAMNGTLPYFTINLPSASADYQVTVDDNRVIKGRDYTFNVVGNPDKVVTVKANGFILSPDANNNYKITNVLVDQKIDIVVQNLADVVSKKVLWLEAGNLQNLLNENETSTVKELTLFGTMNANDFNFIREKMQVNYLDISQVNIVASGANPANAIPTKVFNGYRSLQTILLPKNLTTLKNGCFAQTGLKSIEIPANVSTIEYNIFVACNQLQEVIYRRSNPAWINWCVFNGTPKNRLVVPKGAANTFRSKEYWQDFQEIVEEDAPTVNTYKVTVAENKTLNYTLITEGSEFAPGTEYKFKVDTDDSVGDALVEVYANSTRLYANANGEYSHNINSNTLFHVEFRQPEPTTVDKAWKLTGDEGGLGLVSEVINVPLNQIFTVRANAIKVPDEFTAVKCYAMVLTDKNGGIKEFISPIYNNSSKGNLTFNFTCQVKEASIKEGNQIRLATSYNKKTWELVSAESNGITDRLNAIGNSVAYHTVSMPTSVPGAKVEGITNQIVRGMPLNLKVTVISPIQRATVIVNGKKWPTNDVIANVNIPAVKEDLEIAIMITDGKDSDYVALHFNEGSLEDKLKEYGDCPPRLKLLGTMLASDFNALRARAANIVELDLSDITIKGNAATVNSLPENAFAPISSTGTSYLQKVILPRNLQKIEKNAFARCKALKEISIPASVTFVGQGAFAQCEALTKIVMEGSTPPQTDNMTPLPPNAEGRIILEVPDGSAGKYSEAAYWQKISPQVPKKYYWLKYDDSRILAFDAAGTFDKNKINGAVDLSQTLALPNTTLSSKNAVRRPGVAFRLYDNGTLVNPDTYKYGSFSITYYAQYEGQSTSPYCPRNRVLDVVFHYPITFQYLEGADDVRHEFKDLDSKDLWNANMTYFSGTGTKPVYCEGKDYKFKLIPPSEHISLKVTLETRVITAPGNPATYETSYSELLPDYEGVYVIPNLQGDAFVNITGSISIPEGEPVEAKDLAAVSKEEVEEFKELTITGEVTEQQFEAVREKFEAVETLDLSEIENTSIPANALSGLENLKTVVLPQGVTEIGEAAFKDCKNLESVTIPGVTTIGEGAFYGCENLTSVLLPAAGSAPQTRSSEATGITAESFRGLNPNCLIYLNDVSIPNSEHLNIILNKNGDRVADSDIIIDTNYPFNAPGSFNLGEYKISFTAHIPGSINADVDGGWTGFILPFTPTSWEYGVPIPEREGVNSGLVLRTIGPDDSLVEVTPETFQANRPFLAHVVAPYESVPVTFYARTNNNSEVYDLPFTPSPETMCTTGKNFVLYGSLDGETVMGTTWDINERGDRFVPTESEKIVPFEAYIMPVGNSNVSEFVIGNHDFWMTNPAGAGVSGTNLYRGDKVELTAGTNGATIYYTLDGSNPKDPNGTRAIYSDPIKMEAGADGIMNVKAVAEYKGNLSDVVTLSFQLKKVELNYELSQNWNWISHNMESNVDVAEFMGNSVSRILSQTQDKFRDPKFGLVGNLEVLEPAKAYKVCASESTTAKITGVAFNPTATVKINKGYNWIGCPVDDASLKINDLFANFEAEEGDMIIGLDGFTQVDSFGEWVGTVDALVSNTGYLIYSNSDKEFSYNFVHEPGIAIETLQDTKTAATRTLEDTPWVVDNHKYPSVMPLTASIVDIDGFNADPADYKIAAFCGNECRGIGVNVNDLVMINIHGNVGDNIVIRYIDSYNNEYVTSTELSFDETPVGTISNPYTITLDAVTSVSSIMVDGYELITENGVIVVKSDLATNATVEVYDLAGNRVTTSTASANGTVTINGLEPGIRLIVIRNADTIIYRKIMVK